MNFYLDIETTGFNSQTDKIICIQYQQLNFECKPSGRLVILKEWESSEEDIVKKIYNLLMENNIWYLVPIGQNLIFDLTFLFAKFEKYKLKCPPLSEYLYTKPIIDIKYSLIIANNISFKGSGLDQMTDKKTSGKDIPLWYSNKEYGKIEEYIVQETESFLSFFDKISKKLRELKDGKQ